MLGPRQEEFGQGKHCLRHLGVMFSDTHQWMLVNFEHARVYRSTTYKKVGYTYVDNSPRPPLFVSRRVVLGFST